MKRLILTRHAKSSWDDPTTLDIDRPLNTRGKGAAADLGGWLASRGYLPEEVLVSTALRTRETWDHMAPALNSTLAAAQKPALYNAAADVLLAVLRHGSKDTILLLGHNPGIAEFASRILAQPSKAPGFDHYPTGATLVADFEIENWADLGWATGSVRDFIVPREIPA